MKIVKAVGLIVVSGITLLFIIPLIAILAPILIINGIRSSIKYNSFKNRYPEFLRENEGKKYFVHTNRNNSKEYIQFTLLPLLPSDIFQVEINQKLYPTNFENWCLSHMMSSIKPKIFPMLFKIQNGAIANANINNEFYNTMNQNKDVNVLVKKIVDF